MKKLFVFKKMTAALLVAVILMSMLPVLSFATETEVFAEDFASDLSNWTENVGTVNGGVYMLPGNTINYIKDVELSKVAISADVMIYSSEKPNGFMGGTTAYVTARADAEAGNGYDFGIGVNSAGQTFVRLSLRNRDGVSTVLYQNSAAIDGIGVIKTDTVYNIKIATVDNLIIGIINDVQVIEVEDTTFQSGSVGIRTLDGEAQFDNISVVEVPERRVDSIAVNTHSEEISKVGKVFFTATVYYNSVYGKMEIDQDTEGVSISGLDCTAGNKTVTVKYMGKTATFPVKVVGSIPDEVIYETNFNSNDKTWVEANDSGDYSMSIGGGYASAYMIPNPKDAPVSDQITRPADEMLSRQTYALETSVAILADSTTAQVRRGYASLLFARGKNGGPTYELRLTSGGALNVYYNKVVMYTTSVMDVTGEAFEMGKYYTLKVELTGAGAVMYVNGKLAGLFANFENGYDGYAALKSGNGNVCFDRFKSVVKEPKGDYAISGIQVITASSGVAVGSKVLSSFNLGSYALKAKYADGSVAPFPITKDMLSWYDPYGQYDQVIRITYAGKSCYINYHYQPYLFADNFDVFLSSDWKVGIGKATTYSIMKDRLRVEYDSRQMDNSALELTCPNSDNWTDYSISADVYFDHKGNTNGKNRYAILFARRNSDGSRYELRLTCDMNGYFELVLGRFNKGQYMEVKSASATYMKTALPEGENVSAGSIYNIRLDCVGNVIKGYFEDKLMITYVDDKPFLSGYAGIKLLNNNCMVDNFIAKTKESSDIIGFELSNYPDGDITLWQGEDIPVWENKLVVCYADGVKEAVDLTYEMIGPFSNTEVGKHSINITYAGDTRPIEVTVKERPEYVADVQAQLEAFADSVDADNLNAFLELKAHYDSLSGYEAASLSAAATEKIKKLLSSYDVYYAPELADANLLGVELFNDESSVIKVWGDSIEDDSGNWFVRNGILYQAQLPYGRSGNGWKCPPYYGNMTAISADIQCLADMMHAGVALNVGSDGYYYARISSTTIDQESEPVWEFQFLRKGINGHIKMATIVLEAYDHLIGMGDWFNLTITMINDRVSVYLDGDLIYIFEESEQLFVLGETGLRISTGDAIVDNVRVYGVAAEREEKTVYIKPTFYNDNFEDETVGQDPSHWQEYRTESAVVDNWKIYDKNGNKVYGTTSNGTTATWLHAFDKDPKITVKFMAENVKADGKLGFITRLAPTTAFHIVGYNAAMQKWYISSQDSEAEGAQVIYQEGTFLLESGRWYTAELILEGQKQVLKIDGVEVFMLDEVRHTGYGRMGFYTIGANMYIDDYALTMASGDIPQDGLVQFTMFDDDIYAGYLEIEELPNGTLIGIRDNRYVASYDNGLTWVDVTEDPTYSDLKALDKHYPSHLKMSNGEYIQTFAATQVRVSKDMLNWTDLGQIVPSDRAHDIMGHDLIVTHVNNLTEVVLDDGTHRIFMPIGFRKYGNRNSIIGHYTEIYYSDDWGRTWNMSETTTKDIHPGYTETNNASWCEVKIIKCTDGTLRMYYPRNRLGCMQYVVSHDGGVTWGGLQQIPEIQLALTSYAIFEDPYNPGTHYMICANGTTESLGSNMPRNRFMLLRSYDGINWEFTMNIERMNDYISIQNGTELYQILDPSLYVDEKYVYLTVGRSEREYTEDDAYGHQAQRVYYLRVEKDKLEARPWDASTIADMYYPKTVEIEKVDQTVFGLADLFICTGTLKLTDFLGNVTYEDIRMGATVYKEPNMFVLGTQTVELRYKNGYDLSYEVEIRPKAEILWTIEGEGTVDPKNRYIIEDTTQIVNIIPAEGWKIQEVWVGEDLAEVSDNRIELVYDKNGLDVLVVFTELTIFDSPWFYIGVGGGVLIAAGAALFFILAAKKKKNAAPKQSPEA